MSNDADRNNVPSGKARTAQFVTIGLILLTIITGIFVLQNTHDTRLTFIAWEATIPLAATIMLAVALGAGVGFLVGFIRQRQYRKALRNSTHTNAGSREDKAA